MTCRKNKNNQKKGDFCFFFSSLAKSFFCILECGKKSWIFVGRGKKTISIFFVIVDSWERKWWEKKEQNWRKQWIAFLKTNNPFLFYPLVAVSDDDDDLAGVCKPSSGRRTSCCCCCCLACLKHTQTEFNSHSLFSFFLCVCEKKRRLEAKKPFTFRNDEKKPFFYCVFIGPKSHIWKKSSIEIHGMKKNGNCTTSH